MVFGGSKNKNNVSLSGLSCVGGWKNLFWGVWGGVSWYPLRDFVLPNKRRRRGRRSTAWGACEENILKKTGGFGTIFWLYFLAGGFEVILFLIANKCNENFRVQASNDAQTSVIHVYLFYPAILYIHSMHLHMRLFFSLKTSLQFGTCYLVSSLGSREVRPSIFPPMTLNGAGIFPYIYLLNYSVL